MIVYTLFYYDAPFLEAFLNHYCHIPCIDEILIQNQNWSDEDTLYLLNTAAKYIDDYGVKISIIPSQYNRSKGTYKRAQFNNYSQPVIRNRVAQFLVGKTFITGAPDAAIYGKGYADTNRKLEAFEEKAGERAKESFSTAGFIRIYSVTKEEIIMGSEPNNIIENWKNRVNHFVNPFSYTGARIHDMQISEFRDGRWGACTPKSGHYIHLDFKDGDVKLDLKLLHYHSLFRPRQDSTDFIPVSRKAVLNIGEHPEHYIEKVIK